MKPTIGRIVHYHPTPANLSAGPGPCAAVVTEVVGYDTVELTVFPSGTQPFCMHSVPFSQTPETGCWNWPPRE